MLPFVLQMPGIRRNSLTPLFAAGLTPDEVRGLEQALSRLLRREVHDTERVTELLIAVVNTTATRLAEIENRLTALEAPRET